jgi:hypothetical protein
VVTDRDRDDRDPERRPPPPDPGDGEEYVLALPRLLSCVRCGALLMDLEPVRATHDRFHAGLRELWNGRGSSGGNGRP